MARLTWSAGGPDRLQATVRTTEERLIPLAIDIVTETVEEGAQLQAQALNEAVTRSGEARFSAGRGGSAGRNDTGELIGDIKTTVEQHGSSVIGTWGWETNTPKIDAQEHGKGRAPAADSLWTSFTPTQQSFFRRIIQAIRSN